MSLGPLHTASFPAKGQQQCSGSLEHSSMPISQESGGDQRHVPRAVGLQSRTAFPLTVQQPGPGVQAHGCVLNLRAHWWSSMEQWLHPQEAAALTQSSIPPWGSPGHAGSQQWNQARRTRGAWGCTPPAAFVSIMGAPAGFRALVHRSSPIPARQDGSRTLHCISFSSTTLQQQASGSLSDPISMRPVVTEDLGTGLCR